jgi:hypothetical protein
MPLEFESISHGTIAFGFFNIETDMILLNHYFFFAEDFCSSVSRIAESQCSELFKTSWDIYVIEERERVGNLMGAIHGVDRRGFLGEVYRRFPFPKKREEFKQRPDGFKRKAEMEEMIQSCGNKAGIPILIDPKMGRIAIGEFVFGHSSFQELIRYIWVGGYPRWKDDLRPEYVLSMKATIEKSRYFLFRGLIFE